MSSSAQYDSVNLLKSNSQKEPPLYVLVQLLLLLQYHLFYDVAVQCLVYIICYTVDYTTSSRTR